MNDEARVPGTRASIRFKFVLNLLRCSIHRGNAVDLSFSAAQR
jgi:hypothetical protein